MYHHTPELPGMQPTGIGILEYAAEDRSRGMIGVFGLADCAVQEFTVHPRGIDPSRRYAVTFLNEDNKVTVDGYRLASNGIVFQGLGSLKSRVVLYEEG